MAEQYQARTKAQGAALRRAERNKAALIKERRRYGWYDDGAGKRYRIGIDCVLAGETSKARNYYRWFDRVFDDDLGEPGFLLFGVLAEMRVGKPKDAVMRLRRAAIANPHLIELVPGRSFEVAQDDGIGQWESAAYAQSLAPLLDHIQPDECDWIAEQFDNDEDLKTVLKSKAELEVELEGEPVETLRSRLVEEHFGLRDWARRA